VTRRVEAAPTFERDLKRLGRRYPHIRQDLEPVIEDLLAGGTPGDRLKNLSTVVYKVRIANSDARRGKSGGYRTIYYLPSSERVVLLTIYSKSDQADIPAREIGRIIEEELGD
jgi:mRNA-degrading endonuclease RelE of RelBE toxin-antitoxin system